MHRKLRNFVQLQLRPGMRVAQSNVIVHLHVVLKGRTPYSASFSQGGREDSVVNSVGT